MCPQPAILPQIKDCLQLYFLLHLTSLVCWHIPVSLAITVAFPQQILLVQNEAGEAVGFGLSYVAQYLLAQDFRQIVPIITCCCSNSKVYCHPKARVMCDSKYWGTSGWVGGEQSTRVSCREPGPRQGGSAPALPPHFLTAQDGGIGGWGSSRHSKEDNKVTADKGMHQRS